MVETRNIGPSKSINLRLAKLRPDAALDQAAILLHGARTAPDAVFFEKPVAQCADRFRFAPRLALGAGIAVIGYLCQPAAGSLPRLFTRYCPVDADGWPALLPVACAVVDEIDAPPLRRDLAAEAV